MQLESKISITYLSIALLISFCGCYTNHQNQKLDTAGFENVQIEGELKARLNKNFDRLEEDLYQPQNLFWTEKESNGWPADKE